MATTEGDPESYFAARGLTVVVEELDLHAEHVARGDLGRASFYVEGRLYFCVDLRRDGALVANLYGIGDTREEALLRAQQRFGVQAGLTLVAITR